jgi:hypothetical protein
LFGQFVSKGVAHTTAGVPLMREGRYCPRVSATPAPDVVDQSITVRSPIALHG